VLKYRKIKTFQGNNFTVSSALVIKLNVLEDCLTVKNYWELLTGDDEVGFLGGFYLEGSEFRLDYWEGFWQEV